MTDRNQSADPSRADYMTGKGHGAQGVDKAPGEETSQDIQYGSKDSQKGKKVDADPDQPGDKPVNEES